MLPSHERETAPIPFTPPFFSSHPPSPSAPTTNAKLFSEFSLLVKPTPPIAPSPFSIIERERQNFLNPLQAPALYSLKVTSVSPSYPSALLEFPISFASGTPFERVAPLS